MRDKSNLMPNPEIEEFAKLLVHQVRDWAISGCDISLRSNAAGPRAKRWKEAAKGDSESFAKVIIPDVVDNTIFELLRAIDEGLLKISFTASNGKQVNLWEDGELAGMYAGGDWPSQYSKERFIDDCSDLRPKTPSNSSSRPGRQPSKS